MGGRKGVDLEGEGDGEKLEGVERGEILIRIQCMKISIFNKGKRKEENPSQEHPATRVLVDSRCVEVDSQDQPSLMAFHDMPHS